MVHEKHSLITFFNHLRLFSLKKTLGGIYPSQAILAQNLLLLPLTYLAPLIKDRHRQPFDFFPSSSSSSGSDSLYLLTLPPSPSSKP